MQDLSSRQSKLQFAVNTSVREQGRSRQVVLSPHPSYLSVRLKGLKREIVVDYEWLWQSACKLQVAREKAERKARRVR